MRTIAGQVHGLSDWDVNEEARAHVKADGVLLTLDDTRHVLLPWATVDIGQDYVWDHRATILGVADGRKIRFTAEGPELGRQMAMYAPAELRSKLGEVSQMTTEAHGTRKALWIATIALLAVMISSLGWLPSVVAYFFPPALEEVVGQSAFNVGPETSNPVLQQAVEKVWHSIEPGLQPNPYHFRLKVVQSDEINAFAAPGGYVVVYTALLADVKRPEELAGVLAHESQHVIQRHTLKAMLHSVQFNILLALLFNKGSDDELAKLGSQMTGLAYSRGNEAQADAEGAKVLMRAHIDPTGMVDFFQRLEQEHPIHGLSLMHDHPSNADRIASLSALIAKTPHDSKPLDVDWAKVEEAAKKP
ncbi:MAG TPA: M48 family metallopeptidase [Candidatus Xenobia bacterium]|jgi:Zn-dependent protease with chaperone function